MIIEMLRSMDNPSREYAIRILRNYIDAIHSLQNFPSHDNK